MREESENLEEKNISKIYNYTDSIFLKSFLKEDSDLKNELKLSKEILKKKNQISHMFNKKLGKNFLNQKPESLKIFERRLTKFLFDPDSKFLSQFPKLQKKIKNEKKISDQYLNSKIDMGEMVLYDLKGKKGKKITNIYNAKEKILTNSKNFTSSHIKDIIGTAFYKVKFWDKNSKRLNNIIKNRLEQYKINYINELDLENEKDYINLLVDDDEDNNSIKDLMLKNRNNQREKENLKFNSLNNYINNKINSLNSKNNIISKRSIIGLNKHFKSLDKDETSSIDIKNNNSNSFGFKDLKSKKYSVRNIQNYSVNEKFINSYTPDSKDLMTQTTYHNNLSRNQNNNSNLFFKSNTYRKNLNNISNIKETSHNYLNTVSNFYSKNNNLNNYIFNSVKNLNANSSKRYIPGQILSLKKNNFLYKKKLSKFKNNFNNQISQLNKYTNKCNTELIKLIDGNNDNNFKKRKEIILSKNKLDIKHILIGEKKSKNKKKIKKEKKKEKDSIKSIIQYAIYDSGEKHNDFSNPKVKEKILKRHINDISDEQALKIIGDLKGKGKELSIRQILRKNHKNYSRRKINMNLVRQKVENNYEQMLKLKNMINIDKTKFFNYPPNDII